MPYTIPPRALLALCAALLLTAACERPGKLVLDGREAHAAGEHQKAIELYTAAIEAGYAEADVWLFRADALTMMDRFEQAIGDYTAAIERDPGRAECYNRRGEAFTWLRQPDAALADYTRALTLTPDFYPAFANRGDVYLYARQDHERAIADYDRALELFPDHCPALRGRLEALSQQGKQEQAKPDKERYDRLCATEE